MVVTSGSCSPRTVAALVVLLAWIASISRVSAREESTRSNLPQQLAVVTGAWLVPVATAAAMVTAANRRAS
jgi:hypothetical protein